MNVIKKQKFKNISNCNCTLFDHFSGAYDIKKACYIYIALLLCFILIIDFVIMTDKIDNNYRSEYSKVWPNYSLFFIILILFLTIILVMDYYNTQTNYFDSLIKFFVSYKIYIFIATSIYLLIFGYCTLIEDETNKNSGINIGTITKINNDDISIYSILIGFVVFFICCLELMLSKSVT